MLVFFHRKFFTCFEFQFASFTGGSKGLMWGDRAVFGSGGTGGSAGDLGSSLNGYRSRGFKKICKGFMSNC